MTRPSDLLALALVLALVVVAGYAIIVLAGPSMTRGTPNYVATPVSR